MSLNLNDIHVSPEWQVSSVTEFFLETHDRDHDQCLKFKSKVMFSKEHNLKFYCSQKVFNVHYILNILNINF